MLCLQIISCNFRSGKIAPATWQEWFQKEPEQIYKDELLYKKMTQIVNYLAKCLTLEAKDYKIRPDCDQFMEEITKWSLDQEITSGTRLTSIDEFFNSMIVK